MNRKWLAPSARAVFLLVHGLGGHSARWEFFANFFLQYGFGSYAIELKGFGETTTRKGHIDSFDIYYRDILDIYHAAKKESPGKKIFIAGESMGGLLACIVSAQNPRMFDGLVCISPAFKTKPTFTMQDYIGIFFSLLYNPTREFLIPFDARMCTRDEEYLKIMDSDPLERHMATSKLLWNIRMAQRKAGFIKNNLIAPTLFLLAGKDAVVDIASTERIYNSLRVKDKHIITYPDMYHAMSIDLGRERVFEDILKWVEKII